MNNRTLISPMPSTASTHSKSQRTNWHEAVSCAIQIELRDYDSQLEFQSEYILGKNSYRIDLLVIKKLVQQPISKNIARIFNTYNLFEIKGYGSSLSTDSYYKAIGYAGLLISQTGHKNQYTADDITLTFLSLHFPGKLFRHLKKERKLTVEKISEGIYYINKETFYIQIIVTAELSPDESLYLYSLANRLQDTIPANRLVKDYIKHQEQDIYIKYMHQLTTAAMKMKGESPMICEGILNLCGTSSEEIIARTKKEAADYYLPQIDYLKSLLEQNNIPFDSRKLE